MAGERPETLIIHPNCVRWAERLWPWPSLLINHRPFLTQSSGLATGPNHSCRSDWLCPVLSGTTNHYKVWQAWHSPDTCLSPLGKFVLLYQKKSSETWRPGWAANKSPGSGQGWCARLTDTSVQRITSQHSPSLGPSYDFYLPLSKMNAKTISLNFFSRNVPLAARETFCLPMIYNIFFSN